MAAESNLTAIEVAAANWLVRRDGGLAPAGERELAAWLRADPRHAAAFAALAETWALIGEVRHESPSVSRGRRRAVWFPLALGAAAALATAYTGWWRPAQIGRTAAEAPFALMAATEVGALRRVALPDGSVIQLNTDSAVDVHFTKGERRVELSRGEAHFTVAKNRARPFIVGAAGVSVRVVGTVFNVRLRADSVDVLVTEGNVRIGPDVEVAAVPATHSELSAGQKVSVLLSAPPAAVLVPLDMAASEIKQALAWQARRLDFDSVPLADIVAEFNRYNRHQLVVVDAQLETRRFGGSFPAGDHATLVRMLETNFHVAAERRGDETWLRLRSP